MNPARPLSAREERACLLTLAAIQFVVVVDFVAIMPLGPLLMSLYSLSDAQFAVLVSAYSFAAGASGLVVSLLVLAGAARQGPHPRAVLHRAPGRGGGGQITGYAFCGAAAVAYVLLALWLVRKLPSR